MTTLLSLQGKIRSDATTALKDRDFKKAGFLKLLLSDIQNVGKNKGNRETYPEEALAVVKTFLDKNRETFELATGSMKEDLTSEAEILQGYLNTYQKPQLTDEEILTVVKQSAVDNIGKVMGIFKNLYPGRVDMGKARGIAMKYFETLPK